MRQRYVTPPGGASIEGAQAALRLGLAAAAIAALMAALELGGGDAARAAFWLERGAVRDGQIWRLALAHLVNLSPTHTFLNILGMGLVTITLWQALTPRAFLGAVLASGAAISVGWCLLQPDGPVYVGFSGITHGVFAYGGLVLLARGPAWFGAVVLACLGAKLGQEFWNGPVPGAVGAIGGEVSLISHALGTLGGSLAARGTWRALRLAMIAVTLGLAFHHAQPGGYIGPASASLRATPGASPLPLTTAMARTPQPPAIPVPTVSALHTMRPAAPHASPATTPTETARTPQPPANPVLTVSALHTATPHASPAPSPTETARTPQPRAIPVPTVSALLTATPHASPATTPTARPRLPAAIRTISRTSRPVAPTSAPSGPA